MRLPSCVWALTVLIGVAICGPVSADVGPPRGKKFITVKYKLSSPRGVDKLVYLLMLRGGMNPQRVELSPVVWNKTFSPPSGYRTNVRLVALNTVQAERLVGILEKHPATGPSKNKLAKMDQAAKLKWLRTMIFSNFANVRSARKSKVKVKDPVAAFFDKGDVASSENLYTRTSVPSSNPGAYLLRTMKVKGVKGTDVVWKQETEGPRDTKGKKVRAVSPLIAYIRIGLAVTLVLFLLSFVRRRMKRS